MTAVVFDFDGVLVDSEPLHLRAFQQAFAARGWTLDALAYAERYLGYDDADLLRAYARDHALPLDAAGLRALIADKGAAYQALVGNAEVFYPGAAACVSRLAARFPLAVASGSFHDEIDALLLRASLREPFRAIVGADDVPRSKPAPDPYARAVALLGADASRSIAIEDSPWGLDSARTAGLRTIAVTTTSGRASLAAADRIVSGLEEVTVDLILQLADGRAA